MSSIGIFGGSFNPIHKGHVALARQLLRRAQLDEVWFLVSDYEFHLPRPSYTWNTLQHLSQDYPQHRFTLLIGADNWQLFGQWRNSREIIENYPIVIYPRDGYPVDEVSLPPNVRLVNTRLYNMSSTLIRQLITDGRGVRRYLHPDVISYIESNHLYK